MTTATLPSEILKVFIEEFDNKHCQIKHPVQIFENIKRYQLGNQAEKYTHSNQIPELTSEFGAYAAFY